MFCSLIFSLILLSACSDSDDDNKDLEIVTTNFVLNQPYVWNVPMDGDVFYVLNSSEEMYQYIKSTEDSKIAANMPDFSKYTLLVGNAKTISGISLIETKLINHNNRDYTFEIYALMDGTMVAENSIVAVMVPRLPDGVKVVKMCIPSFWMVCGSI